jgi:hypothetical protein
MTYYLFLCLDFVLHAGLETWPYIFLGMPISNSDFVFWCKTWSLVLREEHTDYVSEKAAEKDICT